MNADQKGFSAVEAVLVIVIVGAIGFVGWYVYHSLRTTNNAYNAATKTSNSATPQFHTKKTDNGLATLTGTIAEGPITPTVQSGNSGTAAVANHALQAKDAQGKIVASTKSDAQGKYTLHVLPGSYTLVLVPQIGPGPLTNNTVQVKAGTNTYNLTADTGIR